MNISNMDILILRHFYARGDSTGGPPEDLRDFLLPRVRRIVYVEHPFPYNRRLKEDTRSVVTLYEKGVKKKEYYFLPWRGPDILFYLKDIIVTQGFLLRAKRRFDLCIALDNLNTLTVLPWRKLGLIRKLVYYTIDFNPLRFENCLLNFTYHKIDRLCCYQADHLWNLSLKMMEGRKEKGLDLNRSAPSISVPMGSQLSRIARLPMGKIERHTLAYVGHLSEKQGVQLILQALPDIRRVVPDAKLVIVGKGEYESELRTLTRQLGIENIVDFRGFIRDHRKVEAVLCRCAIGLAPYVPDEKNFVFYTDPGKPKLYLGCGLPVVITRFPAIADEIEREGAGIAIKYEEESLKQALIRLLTNDRFYATCRQRAITFSKMFDTEHILSQALEETLS